MGLGGLLIRISPKETGKISPNRACGNKKPKKNNVLMVLMVSVDKSEYYRCNMYNIIQYGYRLETALEDCLLLPPPKISLVTK